MIRDWAAQVTKSSSSLVEQLGYLCTRNDYITLPTGSLRLANNRFACSLPLASSCLFRSRASANSLCWSEGSANLSSPVVSGIPVPGFFILSLSRLSTALTPRPRRASSEVNKVLLVKRAEKQGLTTRRSSIDKQRQSEDKENDE